MLPDLKQPKERSLFFTAQVDQKSMSDLTKSIIEINKDDDDLEKIYALHGVDFIRKPIQIFIDSYGGYVYQCFGLIGVIEKSQTPVHTIAVGAAMSCGFLILISGHKRFSYSLATPMYHQVSSWSQGKIQDIKEDLRETERLQSIIETLAIKRTRISQDQLKDVREKKIDWYMTAEDALKYGVIDEII